MKRKIAFLFSCVILFSLPISACMCFNYLERSQEDLSNNYDYIAVLQVKELRAHPTDRAKYLFDFEVLEQLQGVASGQLAVASYHPDFQEGPEKTMSSCDFILEIGKRYLIFANREDQELITNYCNIVPMTNADGRQEFGFKSPQALLRATRLAHKQSEQLDIQTGTYREAYDNGQAKYKARFKNGRLHGSAKRWHKNGERHIAERCSNGQFHGKQKRWASNENYCIRYKKGIRVGKAIYFGERKKEKYKAEWYNANGVVVKSEQYDESGNLRLRTTFDPQTHWHMEERYNQGKLISRSESNEKTGEEKSWKPK